MDFIYNDDELFQWPHNVFALDASQRRSYNDAVRDHVQKALAPFGDVLELYNDLNTQRVVFEESPPPEGYDEMQRHQYNMALPFYNLSVVERLLGYIRSVTTSMQLVNISFGFIHSTMEDNVYMFKYPSYNTQIMRSFQRMFTLRDADNLRPHLEPEALYLYLQNQFAPTYKYSVVRLLCLQVNIWTNPLFVNGRLSSNDARAVFTNRQYLWAFETAVDDDMCAYRAFAAASFDSQLPPPTLFELYSEVIKIYVAASKLHLTTWGTRKFNITFTMQMEQMLQRNIRWYDIRGELVPAPYTEVNYSAPVINILLIGSHCAYIANFDEFKKEAVVETTTSSACVLVGCGDWFIEHHAPWTHTKSVWTFPRTPIDGCCYARCLAAYIIKEYRRSTRLTQMTKTVGDRAKMAGLTLEASKSIDIKKTWLIEELFGVNIRYHFFNPAEKENLQYSTMLFTDTIHIAVSGGHYAYVNNFDMFNNQHYCVKCRKIFKVPNINHERTCKGEWTKRQKRWKFVDGFDRPRADHLTTLEHLNILIRQTEFKQRFVFFDIECLLAQPDQTHFRPREMLRIEQEHVPVSVALAYSQSSWQVQNPKCFVADDGNPEKLVQSFHSYLMYIYEKRHAMFQYYDYRYVFEALESYAKKLECHVPPACHKRGLVRKFSFQNVKISEEHQNEMDEGYDSGDDYYPPVFEYDDKSDCTPLTPCYWIGNDDDFLPDLPETNNMNATQMQTVATPKKQIDEGEEDSDVVNRTKRTLKMVYNMLEFFDLKAYRLNIVGFNSSKYDLNALRPWLMPLLNKTPGLNAVKRNNRYLILCNNNLRFSDIYLFMSPQTSLVAFQKAYLRTEDYETLQFNHKLEFPYEYMTSVGVLADVEMPPIEYFTRASRKTFIDCTDEVMRREMQHFAEIKRAQAVADFKQQNCKTLRDYLVIYNKADVSPAVRSIENLCALYKQTTRQDLFDFITLPSLAKHTALKFTPPNGYFMRFSKKHSEYYHAVRNAITGGASIVWTRLAESGKSKIRPYEYGDNAMLVQRIIGLDMSGCYLYATSQEHLTGPYFIRTESGNFAIENRGRHLSNIHAVMSIEYHVWQRFGYDGLQRLQHVFNGGEKQLMMPDGHIYSVDGYVKFDNGSCYAYEYYGCYYHNHLSSAGCWMKRTRENENFCLKREKLREKDIRLVVTCMTIIRECEWYTMLRNPKVRQFLESRPLYHTWRSRNGLQSSELLPMIINDKLKGLFEVDAYVPKAARKHFHDVQPFFYQKEVTWEMIGNTMRHQMVCAGRKFKAHKLLLNPPFCEKLFLAHYYLKWLVEHGVVIHKIYRLIEYPLCSTPFAQLGELICCERQKAAGNDATEHDKASADSWKLIGNSIYGQFCMQPDAFSTTRFLTYDQMVAYTNKRETRQINNLGNGLYEVTFSNENVTVKQCPHMAVGVYQHAKLRMLDFEHDFSRLLNPQMYCLILTDTDSYYFALARSTWEECVREGVTPEQILVFKNKYFCLSPDKSKYMGLFHLEFEGHTVVALQPKIYYAQADVARGDKMASRGINKRDNTLEINTYRQMLEGVPRPLENEQQLDIEQYQKEITQRSFRVVNNSVVTVKCTTTAFNTFYSKRKVLPNNIDTADLDWEWPTDFTL